jgi:hypothetical protein
VLCGVLLLTASACVPTTKSGDPGALKASIQDTMTEQDFGNTTATTAYDAIKEIHPDMLTGHGRGEPLVYVGTTRQSAGLDRLKQLRPTQVSKVIYLKPLDAERAFGEHTEAGVLVVTLTE